MSNCKTGKDYWKGFVEQESTEYTRPIAPHLYTHRVLALQRREHTPGSMAAKKVDALEKRLKGEMSQIKATVEDRISSVEDKVSSLEDKVSDLPAMMKKLFENQIQTAAPEAKGLVGKMTNPEFRRRENDVEIMERC
ncbi:hypothetical protein M5K25_018150 [Dendrobium thyrsiflorum]|uniref:Uncharacterized protein n=1 Tax=Dendrobium thyrsiflorum TaxID=117978 RepID=A0ABD0UPG7_DENTH